jgi:hypothetical protein
MLFIPGFIAPSLRGKAFCATMDRREFLKTAGVAGALPFHHKALEAHEGVLPKDLRGLRDLRGEEARGEKTSEAQTEGDRAYWVRTLRRLADPVLNHLAAGTLKARMPVEQAAGADRRSVTHLEALGRLIAGIAPWIELAADETPEGRERGQYADLARRAIARAVDPASPDALNFAKGGQPLVDAAFLAQGLLRARRELVERLDPATRRQLVDALESTRVISPGFNNWLLFSATVEAALAVLGARWDRLRVDYALRQHEQWYKGDGAYGDGPAFHWDYYNSFVIQPMLVDVLDVCRNELPAWKDLASRVEPRARRYAAILERLIAPDGSFPAIGRSIAYRFGAFQVLAQMALRRALPENVTPAQVRGALTALIRRSIEAPGTFDGEGWLRIGFCGHQPGIGESYISTGSLYLCAVGLLPLGLPPADEFWSAPAQPWTAVRAWSGQAFPIDRAISG